MLGMKTARVNGNEDKEEFHASFGRAEKHEADVRERVQMESTMVQ